MIAGHKRFAYAAAACLAVAAVLAVVVFTSTASKAYGLEQTAAAYQRLLDFHARMTPPDGDGLGEAWAQFTEDGALVRFRADFPATEDGAKVGVWQAGKAHVWFKDKNLYVTVSDPEVVKRFCDLRERVDPKLAFERLQSLEHSGKVDVQIRQSDKSIEVTVTGKAADGGHGRSVYTVDPQTKLVVQIDAYTQKDGQWIKVGTSEYLDYNQPVADAIWQPKLPPFVIRIDQTAQTIGLPKGDLTDEEMAVKVAREFFEALIAQDYNKAGQIYEGMPAAKMKEGFGKVRLIRIISIGQPRPHPDPRTEFLQVPVKVEYEEDGQVKTREFVPNIRAAYNQPDRWVIGGGI